MHKHLMRAVRPWLAIAAGIALMLTKAAGAEEPGNGLCLKPDAASASAIAWPRVTKKMPVDASCWIDEREAARQEKGSRVTWIDVRPPARARANPMNGALQIPLAELSAKGFLRGESLVLVGTGFDRAALAAACKRLNSAGFTRVRALEGGILAWHAAGRFVGGAGFVGDEVSPEDFIAASATERWRLVTVGLDANAIAHLPEAPAQALPAMDAQQLVARIDSARNSHRRKNEPTATTLVIAPDGERTQAMKRELNGRKATTPLLWLQGGWAAYGRYVEQQHQIVSNAGRTLRRPCGT